MKTLWSFLFALLCVSAQAQTLPSPPPNKDGRQTLPPRAEMQMVYQWNLAHLHQNIKYYSQERFARLSRDEQAELEGYGYLIVYQGYPTWGEIRAFEARYSQIVSRSYDAYKAYLYENNPQRFKELFE